MLPESAQYIHQQRNQEFIMADKGIRIEANRRFLADLPARENSTKGNTAFRKGVIAHIMEAFGVSLASAATHYNHAFQEARKAALTDATLATSLEGLGRPEDKKGGRKAKPEAAVEGAVAEEQQTVFTVCKKSDGSVVAENLSFEAAQELVNKAAAAKKAKLYFK